jgi:hypothetical protein
MQACQNHFYMWPVWLIWPVKPWCLCWLGTDVMHSKYSIRVLLWDRTNIMLGTIVGHVQHSIWLLLSSTFKLSSILVSTFRQLIPMRITWVSNLYWVVLLKLYSFRTSYIMVATCSIMYCFQAGSSTAFRQIQFKYCFQAGFSTAFSQLNSRTAFRICFLVLLSDVW